MKSSNDLKDLKRMMKTEATPVHVPAEGTVRKTSPRKRKTEKIQVSSSNCADVLGIKVGGRVVLMDADIHGNVTEINGNMVRLMTDDGLMMYENIYDLAAADPAQEKALKDTVVKKGASLEKEKKNFDKTDGNMVVDLHLEALPCGRNINEGCQLEYQMEVFKRVMRENIKHRGKKIIFIHGVGDGILKQAILKELEEVYAMRCTWNPYHSGATSVTIR